MLNTPVGIEAYDLAITNYFSEVPANNGEFIPVVFARPDRAFASFKSTLPGLPEYSNPEDELKNIPLPFISVWRLDPVYDSTRENTVDRKRIRINGEMVMTREDKSKCLQTTNFLPYNITYQIELWCRDIFASNTFTDFIRWKFPRGGTDYLSIDFGEPFGVKRIPTFERSLVNNSDIEPGEEIGLRRLTFDIEVQGYFLGQGKEKSTVWGIQTEIAIRGNGGQSTIWNRQIFNDEEGNPLISNLIYEGIGEQCVIAQEQGT